MATATVNGAAINYFDNRRDAPAVVWSHGFLLDHTMFGQQLTAFGDRYRFVAWDERGFGGTRAEAAFDFWDSADDVVALMDHLGIESAVLAGMSQGGFLSMRAALAHPDRVDGLILLSTQAGVELPETHAGLADMAEHWQSDEPLGEVGDFFADVILGDSPAVGQWLMTWNSRRDAQIEHSVRALLERDDISSRIGEIQCPALVVHGREDQAITLDRAEFLASNLPDCRAFVTIPSAGHAPNITHPAEVNQAIADFLQEIHG